MLIDRRSGAVIVDEAHRSQCGFSRRSTRRQAGSRDSPIDCESPIELAETEKPKPDDEIA